MAEENKDKPKFRLEDIPQDSCKIFELEGGHKFAAYRKGDDISFYKLEPIKTKKEERKVNLMRERRTEAIIQLGMCICINGELIWLKPGTTYKVGEIERRIELFLYVDENGIINFYSGYNKEAIEYLKHFL